MKFKLKKIKTPAQVLAEAKAKAERLRLEADRRLREAQAKAISEAKRREQAIKDKINKAIAAAKLKGADVHYAPLLPFKKIMSDALDRRAINHNTRLSDIAPKFLNHVVNARTKKPVSANVLNGGSMFVQNLHPNVSKADGRRFYAEEAEYTEAGSTAAQYEVGAKETKNVIQKIIAWFKERKAKKQAEKEAKESGMADNSGGESLTAEESAMLGEAETVASNLVGSASADVDDDEAGVLGTGFSMVQILIGVAIASLLIFGLKKMFSK